MRHYSAIIFQMDIDEGTPSKLESLLKNGTKVFYFTYDLIDSLKDNEFLGKAVKEQMLFMYAVRFHQNLDSDFIYNDGEIPGERLNLLSDNASYFNKEQYLVEHSPPNENIVVSAGAGTGKTTVMISRLLFLKYKNPNLSFSDIGLITFTNKAASNMREKLTRKLKVYFEFTKDLKYLNWLQELKNMTIGTIHFFAEKILHYNKEILFDYQKMRITQFNYKRRKIIEGVIEDFHMREPELFRKFKYIEQYRIIQSVEMIIDQLMNHSISLDRLLELDFGHSEDDSSVLYDYIVKETCKRLEDYKSSTNSMDVNDLIISMDKMISRNEHYHVPFQYVIVDEFQDTDRIQTKFFAYLANRFSVHLFVVGDVKQSIYRFRGADYTAFKQLNEQTHIHRTYYLQHNYRTDQKLLDKLNRIFSVWPEYVSTFSFEKKDHLLTGFESIPFEESPFMIKNFQTKPGFINFLREIENTNTVVLLRTNKEVNELSRLCEEKKIFYISDQDGDFYRSLPVREFYLLARRFTHPNSLKNRYALHLSSYGERTLKVQELLDNLSPDRTLRRILTAVDPIFEEYENKFLAKPPFEAFYEIIEKLDPAKTYAERFIGDKDRGDERVKTQAKILYAEYRMNLDHLLFQLKREMENTVPTLYKIEKILRMKMQTDNTISTLYKDDTEMERLSIMTVHKAKGLEFDRVFLPHTDRSFINFMMTDCIVRDDAVGYKVQIKKGKQFENNVYRKFMREERIENMGEEARLLYVALTRAKKVVYVDAPEATNNKTVRNWGDLIAKGLSEGTIRQTVF